MSTSTQPIKHHTADELKRFEKQMEKEEVADKRALSAAEKQLAAAEKNAKKAEKSTVKAVHTHDKALKYEHKTEDKARGAVKTHDAAVKNEQKTAREISLKQEAQRQAAQAIQERRADLQRVQNQQEINATHRDQRLGQFSATSEVGPSAAR